MPGRHRRWIAAGVAVLVVLLVGAWAALEPEMSADTATVAEPAADRPRCRHRLTSEPPGASVHHGPVRLGTTPVDLERPCGASWSLRLTLASHQPVEKALTGDDAGESRVLLQAIAPDAAVPEPDAAVTEPDAAPTRVTAPPKATRPAKRRRPARPEKKREKPHLFFR